MAPTLALTLVALALTVTATRAQTVRDVGILDQASYVQATSPKVNIFSTLSSSEINATSEFVLRHVAGSNSSRFDILDVATLMPNKTDAIAYLDGSGKQPPRYAQVSVRLECAIKEYMVGPLPIDNSRTKVVPLDWMYRGNSTQDVPGCGDANTPGGGLDSPYSERLDWNGDKLSGDDKAAPLAILPDGARHGFDPKENYISWMDFSFFLNVGRTGLSLFDIRFKKERIVYEISMQEALAHYAGVNADASNTAYLDAYLDFTPGKLVPGYDCPSYATYGQNYSFCLFEYPKDYPIQRHTDTDYYHVTNNIAFLVRAVSTIGNYDYQITYEFYLDGSVQIIARASGYIAWTDWKNDPLDPSYGFHIRPNNSGSMHDHVLNFKIDIDIHGTANSLFKTEFVPVSTQYPWSNGRIINTMKVERSFVTNENQGKINWAENAAASYAVVNKDKRNQYGEYPGFKIYPSTGASIYSTVRNSTLLGKSINWATHQLFALQRKDSEPSSVYEFGIYNIDKPLVDLHSFFDGESLDQTDLVLYFNLGMHHMPDTSDLPNTVYTGAQSGITIRPQNYLMSDASRSTKQMVHIDDRGKVNMYGAKKPTGNVDLGKTNPDLASIFAPR